MLIFATVPLGAPGAAARWVAGARASERGFKLRERIFRGRNIRDRAARNECMHKKRA
jgi:hypothetical protein